MNRTPEEKQEIQRMLDDSKRLGDGITNLTLTWASLENVMVTLLARILQEDSAAISSSVYFSLPSLDARLRAVEAAFRAFVTGHPAQDELEPAWKGLMNRINRLKGTRNKVAHGQIVTISSNGKNWVRLTAPLFDFKTHHDAIKAGQLPGLGPSDVEQSVAAAGELRKLIDIFRSVVECTYKGDDATLQKKLAELAAQSPNPDSPNTQTHAEQKDPPQSSQT